MTNRWKNGIAFLAILSFFLYFAREGVRAHFAADDMMNIGLYWPRGWWLTLADNLRFWAAVRPMGGLFYMSAFRMFGLNPLPYHVVELAFLFGGAWLSYLVAELLTKSQMIALVTGIVCCAHATMVDVYFGVDTIYDVLARFFGMLLLFLYVRIRERGEVPSIRQVLLMVLVFAAALDSKEISVIFAGSVLSYEVIFHGWPQSWNGTQSWLKKEGLVPALLITAALLYTVAKVFGPNPLANLESYRLVPSKDRYLDNNVAYGASIFFLYFFTSRTSLVAVDIALLLLFSHRWAPIRWGAFYVLTATLPISFIVTRGGSSLLVPLFGWALLIPTLIASIWTPSWKYSKWAIHISLAVLLAVYLHRTTSYWRDKPEVFFKEQEKTWRVITQLKALHFQPKPGSKVIVVNDPWIDRWDMTFISELAWDDPSVQITMSRRLPAPPGPAELAKYDSVLEFGANGNLRMVR